jgi:hypothetical protein
MPITPDHVRQIFKGLESGDGTAFFRRVERARPSIVKADIVVGIRPTPPTAARARPERWPRRRRLETGLSRQRLAARPLRRGPPYSRAAAAPVTKHLTQSTRTAVQIASMSHLGQFQKSGCPTARSALPPETDHLWPGCRGSFGADRRHRNEGGHRRMCRLCIFSSSYTGYGHVASDRPTSASLPAPRLRL